MYVRPFEYVRAGSLAEASEVLAGHGGAAHALAGGQSLLPLINVGLAAVDVLVDIGRIPDLDGVSISTEEMRLGPLVTHRRLEREEPIKAAYPLLAAAARHIGHARIRNRGTIGGSLAHNDPSGELPLAMAVLGAEYRLVSGPNRRAVPAAEFSLGSFTTALDAGELIAEIRVPGAGPGWGWGFREFSRRPGDFALAAAAALAYVEEGSIRELRLGITGLGGGPVRCMAYEEAVRGLGAAELGDVEGLIAADFGPVMDGEVSAEYRSHLAVVVAARAVSDAVARAERAHGG